MVAFVTHDVNWTWQIIMLLKRNLRQVTVLHVYHHVSIAFIWWMIAHHAPGGDGKGLSIRFCQSRLLKIWFNHFIFKTWKMYLLSIICLSTGCCSFYKYSWGCRCFDCLVFLLPAYFSAAINSAVHVFMYLYYFLSALFRSNDKARRKYLFWGK